jgi:2-polyprenyl-3-methyl-5-hydroxy-6-metoxy-1,4-benzoquinol methylase
VDSTYYTHVRVDIAPLLPAEARRIVDVGCGSGATLGWLRTLYPTAYTIGLEGNAALRSELEQNATEAHILDLNGELPDLKSPDLMLFLDVLEHLPQPEAVLRRFVAQLALGGTVIVSVPNVAHLSVALPLLFKGTFTYQDAGILDRTHLRFFDKQSVLALLGDAGLAVDQTFVSLHGRKSRLIDLVTFGAARSQLATQFIVRGGQDAAKESGRARWRVA